MTTHPVLRQWVRDNPVPAMAFISLVLLGMQVSFTEEQYTRISVAMIFLVFAFKSWVNLVFAVTTHKQHGETALSIATERYFWSLLGQSVIFAVLFFLAFLDSIGIEWFGRDLVMVRNFIRSIAVISVVSVIIYGDQTLEALRDHILAEASRRDDRDARQNARTDRQDRREARQDARSLRQDQREAQ